MNGALLVVAATLILAGPVIASVVAPSFVTQVAQQGFAVQHHRFVFNEQAVREHDGVEYVINLYDGDLYEMPLTTQVALRGAVIPAPSDEVLRAAFGEMFQRYSLPVLSYDIARDGEDIEVKATLPAGMLANLSPRYQELLDRYEV